VRYRSLQNNLNKMMYVLEWNVHDSCLTYVMH